MHTRILVGLGERLRDVDADHEHRQFPAHSDSDRVLELLVGPIVECVARVVEDGDAEVARQVVLDLDARDQLVLAADALGRVAVLVGRAGRRQLVEPEAAQRYLESYFGVDNVNIFWGNTRRFLDDFRQRTGLET